MRDTEKGAKAATGGDALDDLDQKMHRTGQVEHKSVVWQAGVAANGQRYLALSGTFFPSLPGVFFGLVLNRKRRRPKPRCWRRRWTD